MTIAYTCILIMVFIPLFCIAFAKFSSKRYDNKKPREFLDNLDGRPKRAHYAEQNSYEVFAPFAAAVIIAHLLQAPQQKIDVLAMSFVGVRILYIIFYIYDLNIWRTVSWFMGLFVTLGLFFIAMK